MMFFRRILPGLLAFLCTLAAQALPIRFYDAEVLSSNQITCLCQDQQGYIWIATEYGLNKFDGVHVTQYYNDDSDSRSLSDNIVRKVMTSGDGTLWVVTNIGVQCYNRMTDDFETVLFGESREANVNDILETSDGRVWLLSAENGLYEAGGDLRARPVEAVHRRLNLRGNADNMYLDRKGRLWVSYEEGELQMIDLRSGKSRYFEELPRGNNRAVDIIEDGDGRLTVLTYSGLLRLNERTQRLETVVSYPRNAVHRIYKNQRGELLVGMSGSGLWLADFGQRALTQIRDVDTDAFHLETSKVHAYLEDRGGNHWVGCYQRGVLFVSARPAAFRYMPLSGIEGSNGLVLRSVYADSRRHLYICQEKGGMADISEQGRRLRHWMGNHTVTTVYETPQYMFWVGTYRDGLFRLDPQTGREEPMPLTANQRVSSVTQDRQGNLYTAVFSDGLHSYTPDGKTERALCKGKLQLHNPYLNTLFTDKQGRVWIGHYYGIDVYDPATDRLVDVGIPAALRPAIVYAIGQSPRDNAVWVGTNKGLFRYHSPAGEPAGTEDSPAGEPAGTGASGERGQWRRFTVKDGLPNDIVCGFVITADGTVWLSTYRGLGQLSPDGHVTRYYRGNGLQEWSYLRGVYARSTAGEVIFGNQDGITCFSPDKIVKDAFSRGITLTGMRLGDADVHAGTLSGDKPIISKPLDMTDDITVAYTDNTFSLRFSSMDFRDPQNVHYEFRFEGEADNQWYQTESGRSEIYFSHLSVGSHKLQVRAYDNGVYSPVKTLTLQVSPPWYRTWGAYLFYLILLAGIVALWWRNYWNRRQAETNEEKIKFFVDISHELRSPLTLIKSPLDQLLRVTRDPAQTRALRNIERNTNRLLTLTNEILSIRKIEKGQMQMRFAETPLGEFVGDICHDYDYQAGRRQLTLTFENKAGDMAVWIDRDHFDKVVTNLLGNAMKYVQEGGEVTVTVRLTADGHAELSVRDNGPGIDEAQLRKVFERFYQASARPAGGQMSYGIGLNLTQKIVALHKGAITARNRTDGPGSEFIVRLPLGNGHLPKEQLADSEYHTAEPAQEDTPTGEPAGTVASGKPRRARRKTPYSVAVVDDEEEIRTFLQTELGESYRVATYADGQKALEGIVDTVPDLVISDVVMPRMDGLELLKRLKASTTTSHIPVILLTTRTEHESRVEGLEEGADAYVDKPFNLEELEARIASLIANRMRMKGKFSGIQEQEDTVRKIELKGNDAALMEKIMKAVNTRLDDSDFNVEALADEVGLSRVQLHRRMKELTGITVGEFIRNLRLQQAAKLLAAGDTTVAQVTYAVGFSNPTHFTSAFKKHFGVTPSEYMAKHKGKE